MPLGARSGSSRRWLSCSRTGYLFVAAAAEPVRAVDAPADRPRLAATASCVADGGGLPVVRSTVPDGDGVGQVGTARGHGCGGSAGCGRCSRSCWRRGRRSMVSLDERLLGATSNAVERGNRRYRKMHEDGAPGFGRSGRSMGLAHGPAAVTATLMARAQTTKTLRKARSSCRDSPVIASYRIY